MNSELKSRLFHIEESANKNNLQFKELINLVKDSLSNRANNEIFHEILDIAHLSNISNLIYRTKQTEIWFNYLVEIIKISNYNVGFLLRQRANRYQEKIAFQILKNGKTQNITYMSLWKKIIEVGKSLNTFKNNEKYPVIGLLTHNQLNGALVDLACLSFGIKVIPIPLNSTEEHVSYIIEHAEISHLFIGGKNGENLWNRIKNSHSIKDIILNENNESNYYMDWSRFLENSDKIKNFDIEYHLNSIDINSTQTIMYTSGTTANPKGIVFNQLNIITKRYGRAIALPQFNSNDVFLAYLPLFHTFGRYFEMLGSLFWGANYGFAESPAFNSLLNDFKLIKPTIFISIPKRWVQLYNLLENDLDLDFDEKSNIEQTLKKITGGNLKWGLSAAGFLDPDIFIFFQSYGINLLSGYGMTEATGGITMTNPGNYVKDSVGTGLPGIQLKLEHDGELCLRGPYVIKKYYKDKDNEAFLNGWFHTGDIFKELNGHYFIIDRKKDIYKNSRGQTIAPQKIENLFQDFDSIKSIFLVGDGKEFNALLIFPNYSYAPIDLHQSGKKELRDFFSSIILSVNSFLAPFERIVNYVIIQRDFSREKGELTHKGSFKRNQILKNFKTIIDPLYEKNYLSLQNGSNKIKIPNWLTREIGTVKSNISWNGSALLISDQSKTLKINWIDDNLHIGDFLYYNNTHLLDLELFIQCPSLWLGNFSFSKFTGESIFRLKESKKYESIKLIGPSINYQNKKNIITEELDTILFSLHKAVNLFLSNNKHSSNVFSALVDKGIGNWKSTLIKSLMALKLLEKEDHQNKMIEAIAPILSGELFLKIIKDEFSKHRKINPEKGFTFNIKRANNLHFQAILEYLKNVKKNIETANSVEQDFIKIALLIIAEFGTAHPTRFVWSRSELVAWQQTKTTDSIYSTSQRAYYNLIKGFRSWIGQTTELTVDPESGKEYSWDDVISFDDNVRSKHKMQLLEAISKTPLIRESIFLFSKNCLINLHDIPKNGIWIHCISKNESKSVFRVLVKTRTFGAHNLVINMNESLGRVFIDEETKWLIIMSSGMKNKQLVENFGGYYPEYNLYTEEYIRDETLNNYFDRNKKDICDQSKIDRWQMRWLHYIWNGIQAYQEFWFRTNYQLSIQPPSPNNLVIPKHDYKTGTRLISISKRKKVKTLTNHFLSLYTDYIINTEKKYPGLNHMSDWEVIFTATLQALKVKEGERVLNLLKSELNKSPLRKKCSIVGLSSDRIEKFLLDIKNFGVLTKPVVFASLRYERWLELNEKATLNAKASILQELYKDYGLDDLLDDYPETRVRFFMMTCFKGENPQLNDQFQLIIKDLRNKVLSPWDIQDRISDIKSKTTLNQTENFFLARMIFPHVDAADYVELVTTLKGEKSRLDLAFQIESSDGNLYTIRPAFHPKEITSFHTLLNESSLSVTFTSDHEFLFAFNARNRLIGGLFWKNTEQDKIHLEWVAVRKKYQKISLSKHLMNDLFKRMRHKNIKIITVGFYAEKFFSKHGFKLNKKYGGLVKEL